MVNRGAGVVGSSGLKDFSNDFAAIKPEKKDYLKERRFNLILERVGIVQSIFGIFRCVITSVGNILDKVKPALGMRFNKVRIPIGLSYNAVDLITSCYGVYSASKGAYQSNKIGDMEGVRDNSLSVGSASSNIIGTSSNISAFAIGAKSIGKAASLGIAGTVFGVVSFSLAILAESISFKRVYKAAAKLKSIFASDSNIKDKYLKGLNEWKKFFELNDEEKLRVVNKSQGDLNKQQKEINRILAKKYRKLERRVGPELAAQIQDHLGSLIEGVTKNDQSALDQACELLNKCRKAYNRDLYVRTIRIVGCVIGLTACLIWATTPIGGAILITVFASMMFYAWYQKNRARESKFETIPLGLYSHLNYRIEKMGTTFFDKAEEIVDSEKETVKVKREPSFEYLPPKVQAPYLKLKKSNEALRSFLFYPG